MSKPTRDSSAALRVHHGSVGHNEFGPERTMVDVQVPTHRQALPRVPKATTPPNVIPFTKPRAIAAMAAANPASMSTTPIGRDAQDNEKTRVTLTPRPAGTMPPPVAKPHTPWQPKLSSAPAYHEAPMGHAQAQKHVPIPPMAPPPPVMVAPPPPVMLAPPMGAAPNLPPLPAPVGPAAAHPTLPFATEAVALPAPPKHDPHKWAIYDKLGLGAPKIDSKKLAKWIVSAYRLLGFVILTIIVVVLVGYITTTAFFYVSNSWVVPMAVSPSDERVVTQQAALAEQQNQRDRIADELAQADRLITSQQTFQAEFAKAIQSDLDGRKNALGKIRALASAAGETRAAIRAQSSAYAAESNRRMAQEYKAGLIDRSSMLSGKFQQAQITSSNLGLAERQAEYETRAAELEQNAKSLDALLDTTAGNDTALSYEVLKIKQELEASRLELAKAVETRNSLKVSLERQEKLIASLSKSAYLRAVNDKATVTFVPYGNLSKVEKGSGLYGCKLGMIICHHVGDVLEVLPGEVVFKHPHKDKQLRGQMVEVKLDAEDADAAEDEVLFVGGKPLFL